MKKTLRRICSFMLVIAMVLALCPAYLQNVYAEDGDAIVSQDDVVVASTSNADGEDAYSLFASHRALFYEVAAQALSKYDTAAAVKAAVDADKYVKLTHGDVKGITKFVVGEDSELTDLYELPQYLPNLDSVEIYSARMIGNNSNIFGESGGLPATLKSITIKAHSTDVDENGYAYNLTTVNLDSLDRYTQLETLDINVDSCYYNYYPGDETKTFSFPASLRNLSIAQSDSSSYGSDESDSLIADAINGLSNLESLNVSGHRFADKLDYTKWLDLKTLILNNCDLGALPNLTDMKKLEVLSIAGNDRLVKADALKFVPAVFANDADWVKANFTAANEIVTTGDVESEYDIPDQKLYEALLERGDDNGDGYLTVGEAAGITDLYSTYNVKSFEGLSEVAPNIRSIDYSSSQEDSWDSFYKEVVKLSKLTSLNASVDSQDKVDDVLDMTKLTSLSLYCYHMETTDVTAISGLTELEYLCINGNGNNVTGADSINSLPKLERLSVYDGISVADISNELLGQLIEFGGNINSEDELKKIQALTNITNLYLTFYGDKRYSVDLSKMNKLSDIRVHGNIDTVALPEKPEDLCSVNINNSSSKTNVKNLGNGVERLGWLVLTNCDVKNLSVISICTNLYHLELDGCNLTDTTGLGNLTELDSLKITNNYDLVSIDSGISNLTRLQWLDLSNNGLTALPDLSALCTEDGLLSSNNDSPYTDRLKLYGNELTEDAVKASKLSENFLGDKNWLIDSTSRKYISGGYVGKYYTNLTSAYIYKQIYSETGSSGRWYAFYTDSDVTLNTELLDYIKANNINITIHVMDVNDDYTASRDSEYTVSQYTLSDWSSGDIVLKKINAECTENPGKFADIINGTIYGVFTVPAQSEVSPYVSAHVTVGYSIDGEVAYKSYIYDGSDVRPGYVADWSITSGGIRFAVNNLQDVTLILASSDARIYNNIEGSYCEKDVRPVSDFSVWASGSWNNGQWVENDWQDKLNALIDNASSGATIEMGTDAYMPSFNSATLSKLNDKKIKLVIYSAWSTNADYIEIGSVRTIEFGNVTGLSSMPVYYMFDRLYEYSGGPAGASGDVKLFAGNKCVRFGTSTPMTLKKYVGEQYVNGSKLYLYKADYNKCEVSLIDEYTVNYGCIEMNIDSAAIYYLSDGKLTKTTWENAQPSNPGIATDGNAEPDTPSQDKCTNGHTWETEVVKAATCTEAGTGIRTCSVCGEQEEYEIPAFGHTWNYVVDKPASATEDGSKSKHCATCGAVDPDSVIAIEKYGTEVTLPKVDATEVTSEIGVKSAPASVNQDEIETKSEAVTKLIEKMSETIAPEVKVYTTGAVPTMTSDLFSAAATNNKDITIGAVNDDNQLMYSWTFAYDNFDTSKVPEAGLNLAITFEAEKQEEIAAKTGYTDGVYISIEGFHGQLPGPAKVKTYVGDKYKNGDLVTLYYYNEETQKLEVEEANKNLKVEEGYIVCTLTHCSSYVTSEKDDLVKEEQTPAEPEAPVVTPATPAAPAPLSPVTAKASPKTGDTTFPFIPLACLIAGLSMVGFVVSFRKKETL